MPIKELKQESLASKSELERTRAENAKIRVDLENLKVKMARFELALHKFESFTTTKNNVDRIEKGRMGMVTPAR